MTANDNTTILAILSTNNLFFRHKDNARFTIDTSLSPTTSIDNKLLPLASKDI